MATSMYCRAMLLLAVGMACLLLLPQAAAEHVSPGPASTPRGRGLSGGRRSRAFLSGDAVQRLRDELHMAIASALGPGHEFSRGRLGAVREKLQPMWHALHKNEHGRVDRRSLRYVAHRLLLQTRGLSVLGLEPVKTSATDGDLASLFTSHAPAYVRSLVEGDGAEAGFSLEDAVATVAMIEELVVQQTRDSMEQLFVDRGWSLDSSVQVADFNFAMESYLLRWMMGNDTETVEALEDNETLLHESFDDWGELASFAHGVVKSFMYDGWKQQVSVPRGQWRPLYDKVSITDAQAIAGDLSLEFGRFWFLECQRVKGSLNKLDPGNTGRVKLQAFHNAALEGEWRFSESREYLRQMGALDESSASLGPRVIIANYLQGPSNCIVSDRHYRVCCMNDCEAYMSEIEDSIRAPSGTVEQLLATVGNITMNLDDDMPVLSDSLRSQLYDIASLHDGQVPLHGRLFLQWLHYVFPQECQYPHKSGSVSTLSPLEYGDEYMASEEEMATHAKLDQGDVKSAHGNEDWMTQWSQEEELLAGNVKLKAPWEPQGVPSCTVGFLLVFAIAIALLGARSLAKQNGASGDSSGKAAFMPSFGAKAHLV
eukprot:TRINITY_DN15473_c0_g1_i1.p1 TRINITY_DN15473_c0_g1~~TRINITY_DN15473_c0_g1_i1.p1  ORF type:complete len:597 (-),score=163.36 TRINITY_DN15473_c0_g1_i1:105-1895(-)